MEMDYHNIIKTTHGRLESAHDNSRKHIRKEFFEKEYEFFRKHIKNKKVLVAGSGLGHDSIEIAKNGNEVLGIELIKEWFSVSTEKSKKEKVKNLRFEQGDFRQINYPDEFFDVVVLNMGTIGNFQDKKSLLKEFLRVSKKVFLIFILQPKKD